MRKAICWVLWMSLVGWAWGQQGSSNNSGTVPGVVRFSGNLADAKSKPLSGMVGVTFSLYADEQGGAPLWVETQNVQTDKSGHYSVTLGSTTTQGLPQAIFTSGEARWLGVGINGQAEQPRVLLPSVPYALKAADAETVGGLPPSAFVLAAPLNSQPLRNSSGSNSSSGSNPNAPALGGSGKKNYLPIWTSGTNLGNSALFQSGKGTKAMVGIGTTTPASTLDVNGGGTIRGLFSLPAAGTATATAGFNSQPIDLTASVFNSSTSTAVPQTFQWQSEPVGNNTSNASGSLNLLFAQGTGKPAETGLNIASNGQITFATGQTFPGTGTVTSVGSGLGLTGGPVTSAGTLSIDTSVVPQLGTGNSFTGNQKVNGNVSAGQLISTVATGTAPLQVTSTTQVPNLNASFLDGLSASAFQVAGSYATLGANTFTATQSVTSGDVSVSSGNLDLPATTSPTSGVMNLGGTPFLHACCSNSGKNIFAGLNAGNFTTTGVNNAAFGFGALNGNTLGSFNTAVGHDALVSNTSGSQNTALGIGALELSTTGTFNTATGEGALGQTTGNSNTATGDKAGLTNTAGTQNTFLGVTADAGTGSLTNATAIGANAQVTASNAMVLGSIAGVNGATSSVNVGIGTTAPASTLDVHGTGNFTGLLTFANGQTFPGTGTITGVTPGTDLLGGGTSGNVTLGLDTTKVITGVIAGTDLTGGGIGGVQTLNLDTTKVPQLGTANKFSAMQTINSGDLVLNGGNIDLPPTSAATTGVVNMGSYAFMHACCSLSQGNTFLGVGAGNFNVTGSINTATGFSALPLVSTGYGNTADGYAALANNTTGFGSTAVGWAALSSNTTSGNTAFGTSALAANTTGYGVTASGYQALADNTTGANNTAHGLWALVVNTIGSQNTATGVGALYRNATGFNNTALGVDAGLSNVGGNYNTFIGYNANLATDLNNATVIGANAEVTASNALVLGSINGVNNATANTLVGIGTTAPTYLLHIGNTGGASNFLRVEGPTQQGTGGLAASFGGYGAFQIDAVGHAGRRFTVTEAGLVGIGTENPLALHGVTIGSGTGHAIADGWDTYSSRRWKTNIQTLHGALGKVEQLRGVSYDLKENGKHEVGVIAEEVGAVVPEIVSWEKNGKDAQGVDYSRLTALLIEATKEQQALIRRQQEQIRKQQRQMSAQQTQIMRLTSQVETIQATLKSDRGVVAGVRTAAVQVPAVVR